MSQFIDAQYPYSVKETIVGTKSTETKIERVMRWHGLLYLLIYRLLSLAQKITSIVSWCFATNNTCCPAYSHPCFFANGWNKMEACEKRCEVKRSTIVEQKVVTQTKSLYMLTISWWTPSIHSWYSYYTNTKHRPLMVFLYKWKWTTFIKHPSISLWWYVFVIFKEYIKFV